MTHFLKRMLFEIPFFFVLFVALYYKVEWVVVIIFGLYGVCSFAQGLYTSREIRRDV